MLLFTTVNKRSWLIEVVDQLTAPLKFAGTKRSPNQLFPNFPVGRTRNVDTEIRTRRSTRNFDL